MSLTPEENLFVEFLETRQVFEAAETALMGFAGTTNLLSDARTYKTFPQYPELMTLSEWEGHRKAQNVYIAELTVLQQNFQQWRDAFWIAQSELLDFLPRGAWVKFGALGFGVQRDFQDNTGEIDIIETVVTDDWQESDAGGFLTVDMLTVNKRPFASKASRNR